MRQELLSHFTRRPRLVAVMVLLASLAVSATAIAAAGDLDPTFSGDGRQTTNFSPGTREEANGVAIQSDGKIVVVGHTPVADDDFAVARYNPNGTLDTTFSGDGKQTTDFGGYEQANAVAIQSNGKIVVVGYSANNSTTQGAAFALARYNPNGSLDTSFSGTESRRSERLRFGDRGGDPGERQDRRRRHLLRLPRGRGLRDCPL